MGAGSPRLLWFGDGECEDEDFLWVSTLKLGSLNNEGVMCKKVSAEAFQGSRLVAVVAWRLHKIYLDHSLFDSFMPETLPADLVIKYPALKCGFGGSYDLA